MTRRRSHRVLSCVAGAAAASMLWGCVAGGEAAYKRGATPDQMAADEKACRAETADEDAYLECMRGRGYRIADGPPQVQGTPPDR